MEYKPEDLRIDTFHVGEHSGFVHTNHTAVRITHLPTGAYVESKTERSLHKNKQRCVELLPAAIEAKLGTRSISRAEELISDLEAEIVKRDALISELETELEETLADWGTLRLELASLKSKQQRGGVVLPDMHRCFELANQVIPEDIGRDLIMRIAALTRITLDEVARLNPPGECVAVRPELLERWLYLINNHCVFTDPAEVELRTLLAQQGKAVGK